MKNLLSNVLGVSSFVIINKALIRELGSSETLILGFIVDKWTYFNHDDFYYIIDDLSADTGLSERICRKGLQNLINKNILIKKNFTGLPAKQYYNIDEKMILSLLKNDNSRAIKSDSSSHSKSDRARAIKSDIAYNNNIYNNNNFSNNNKENNNKENNNKSEKIKKSRTSIFSQALELYQPNQHFSLDDWTEWVEYKSARCKNLTLQTFKQNFNFLLNLGSSARASISQSINHNWQGLFEVKQNNSQNSNNSYFKGLSAKQQFSSLSDENYDADAYDFSKLPTYS